MKTPYGEISIGDVYHSSDGSPTKVEVIDIDTYAHCEDVVVRYLGLNIPPHRMDWFKLMVVRYHKKKHSNNEQKQQQSQGQ